MPEELLPSQDELSALSLPRMSALAARCSRLVIPSLQKEWPDLPEMALTAIDLVNRSVEEFGWGGWNTLDPILENAPTERAERILGVVVSATHVLQTAYSGLMAERSYGTSSKGQSSVHHLAKLIRSAVEIDPSLRAVIRNEYEKTRVDESLSTRYGQILWMTS